MSSSEWREVKLGDVVDTISNRHKFDKDEIILINTSDVLEGKVLNHEYVKNVNLKGQFKKSFRKNDILYSEIRPQNKRFAYIDFQSDDYVASTKLMVLRKKNETITTSFLYQILKSDDLINELQVIAESRSGTFPQITYNELSRMKIKLPPLDEQKAIAHILSTLDEKIEVNNEINKTLENMAQAIFKQWFVDFEFPNEDGEPYKSSGGEMVESELGMIPKGWEVRRIGDECFCSLGGTPSRQKSDYWNGDIPWVNSGEVNNFRIYKPSEYITKLGLEKSATKLLKKKTTVLAITGATLGQVSLLEIDTCTNQSVVGISENDKVSHVYIYPYVKSVIKKIIGNQTGGAQQHINKGNVEDTKLLIPNKKVLNAYTKLVRPQYDLISSICFENELLTRLRDSLIPKLMSGEIRVSLDAEDDAS